MKGAVLALAWNPAMGLAEAAALSLAFVVIGLWLAWPNARGATVRPWLLVLRAAALAALAVCWLNPGRWIEEEDSVRRDWVVLLDRSGSMEAGHDEKLTRWEVAAQVAETLRESAGKHGDVHVRPFSNTIEEDAPETRSLKPGGTGSNITGALSAAIDGGGALAGIVVISDGRQTSRVPLAEVALRARGRGTVIHAVPLGGAWGSRDLVVSALPRQVTAFRGQAVKISAQVENRSLGEIRPAVVLVGPDGTELARKEVELANGAREVVTFDLPAVPESGGDYTLRAALWPGEHVASNNADTVRVKVLSSKTRVLLLEGAPYWDSKFLAQLLRQQGAVDILTIHRLSEDRFFRVEAGGALPLESPDSVFPDTPAGLARYDLIVFGKGADGFLNPARALALQGFVREQGGAVLFARGKPYAGKFAAIEPLEPLEWGESQAGGFRLLPVEDASAGLFGAALPDADDAVWPTLPLLEDVLRVARLKPFARVLAEGAPDGRGDRVPMLVARRYGRGMTAVVNADGLWRWDFRPEVRERGGLYQHFWVQLMQWCGTYSEFQPGQDFAVRLAEAAVEPGQPVRATIGWRGPANVSPEPFLIITRDGKPAGETVATLLPSGDGGMEWAAMVNMAEPGRYQVRVGDRARKGISEGDATLTVLAPPGESDDLRPDEETLRSLTQAAGGEIFEAADAAKLASRMRDREFAAEQAKPRWEPLWPKWWFACLVVGLFGSEWWLRRREGLL